MSPFGTDKPDIPAGFPMQIAAGTGNKTAAEMKKWLKQFSSEDWIIVFAGVVILALACIFPHWMPEMPKTLASVSDWLSAGYMFLFVYVLTVVTSAVLGRPLGMIFPSLLVIFGLTVCAQQSGNSDSSPYSSRSFSV